MEALSIVGTVLGVGVAAAVIVRVIAESIAKTSDDPPGLTSNSYILLTIFTWATEMQLLRLAAFGQERHNSPTWRLNGWTPFTLWWPPEVLSHPSTVRSELLIAILGIALAAGIVLNILRLRNAALPIWIALATLIPFINAALFLFLGVTPSRKTGEQRPRNWKDFLLPRNTLGSALVSCVITAVLGLVIAEFGIEHFGSYGWTLFAVGPVVMGFLAAVVYGSTESRSYKSCMYVGMGAVVLIGLAFLGFAFEGIVCIAMAAPIALPLAAFGGWLAYFVQRRSEQTPQIAGALLLFLPFMMYGEHRARTEARQISVSTGIVIHAPADRVWQSVIHLASVPKPESVIFHSVAYPIRTGLEGSGLGATRQCVFSTGSIVEPIKVWDPGRELRFSVVSQPPLMRELTPYSDVHPPHLKLEYLRSREGQFILTPQANGTTLLTGTSYYESRLWPGEYWQLWTDMIAHQVHQVVLREIKRQSEGN
jgi:hypothetical protein